MNSKANVPGGENSPHLVAAELSKSFGDFTALDRVNLEVRRGAIEVIIGGSGAGKTTLLKVFVGLEEPTNGSILIDGIDPRSQKGQSLRTLRRKLGMVFQYSALLDSLDVFENVAFPLREHRKELREGEIKELVHGKLSILGLEGKGPLYPSELSGGMRKRVGLARALILEPEILFYDEPTSGLDPLTSRKVDDLIVETRDRFGVTSVVISHDMAGALRIADRIHLMAAGKLEVSETPERLERSDHPLVADFLRESGLDAARILRERSERSH